MGVAPCDLFLIIFGETGGSANLDANIYTRARSSYIIIVTVLGLF